MARLHRWWFELFNQSMKVEELITQRDTSHLRKPTSLGMRLPLFGLPHLPNNLVHISLNTNLANNTNSSCACCVIIHTSTHAVSNQPTLSEAISCLEIPIHITHILAYYWHIRYQYLTCGAQFSHLALASHICDTWPVVSSWISKKMSDDWFHNNPTKRLNDRI